MKKCIHVIIGTLLAMNCLTGVFAQKILTLDADLNNNSTPMEVKRKGVSTIGKYQFGPYRIVSGKAGWTTTKSKSRIFRPETEYESKSKSSFLFVANNKDSIRVNASTNTRVSETESGDMIILNQSNENYFALITPEYDSVVWKLIFIIKGGEALGGNFIAEGMLSDGMSNILIRQVVQSDGSNISVFNMAFGYEFIIANNSIATVQVMPQKYVWIHEGLDEHIRIILAAASASLLVYSDETENSQ